MADTKITDLTAITGANVATGDQFVMVDVSDTTMASSGTDKKITASELSKAMTPTRQTTTYTTASLANNAQETGTVTGLGKSFRVTKIVADRACRIRLYTSTTARDADATRGIHQDPSGDAGVVLDLVLTSSTLTWHMRPVAAGTNDDTVVTANCPVTIDNRSGSTHTVAVTFTYFTMEN